MKVKNARDLIQDRIEELKTRVATIETRERQLKTLPMAIRTETERLKKLVKAEKEAEKNAVPDEEYSKLEDAAKEAKGKGDKKEAEKAVTEADARNEVFFKAVEKRMACEALIESYKRELDDIRAKIKSERVEYSHLPYYIEEAKKCLEVVNGEVAFKDKLEIMRKDCIKQRQSKGWVDDCKGCPHWSKKFKTCSAEALFKGNPSHYHVGEIEETLDANYIRHCNARRK